MRSLLIHFISIYQWLIRPLLPPSCRFHPSCSCYAQQAIERFGALRGSLKAAQRVMRCHPWNPGGYDPVEPISQSAAKRS
jgi:putative membrane protein insertion efficiency factor